jgi:predicted RNase H-like nuclease (RuvC/YqgF family)
MDITNYSIDDKNMDDKTVILNISKKLKDFNMPPYDSLSKKTQEKLLEVEYFIIKSEKIISNSLDIVKQFSLTKSNIAKNTTFCRKTLYNDKILLEYVEKCSKMEFDYSNLNELKNLKTKYDELKNLYDNILNSLIDIQNLKLSNKKLNEEILYLEQQIENLQKLIMEKEKTISDLQNILRHNNISLFKTR